MAKVPKALIKQVENFEEVINALNGLIDGTKIKLEHYDKGFLETLSGIRKKGLDLRDDIELFKNSLEVSLSEDLQINSRFASSKQRVIDDFLTKKANY